MAKVFDISELEELEDDEVEEEMTLPATNFATPPQGQWTYKDYVALPDDGNRYEIIEGVLYQMPSPNYNHQWTVILLMRYLLVYVYDAGLGTVCIAPFDVKLPIGGTVQPDVMVVLKANQKIINKNFIKGAPDLVIEVSSKGTADYDLNLKRQNYAKSGVKEYWIVRPSQASVEVFKLTNADLVSQQVYTGQDLIQSDIVPDFPVKVEQFFA